jgi:hypothetical protein
LCLGQFRLWTRRWLMSQGVCSACSGFFHPLTHRAPSVTPRASALSFCFQPA